MQFLALLLIFYFFIGACICLLICVNPNDPGMLGTLNRFAFKKVPTIFSRFIIRIFGERVLNFLGGIKHYLMETNHPIVQIFYLLIAVGGFICYQIFGIFKHMPNSQVSDIHVILANFMAMVCFWVYYKACATQPGEITKQNVKQSVNKYEKYYDDVIYKHNNQCRTCKVIKPARSKHCSICQMCVAKYDHHCVWIRQCVGERNYKYFVAFLLFHSLWCLYLSLIGTISLLEYLDRTRFWGMTFNIGGVPVKADRLLALQYIFMTETIFFFLIVMCAIMGFTLFIFVAYHFYLIYKGQTTNERVRKNDEIDYYNKEIKAVVKFERTFVGKDGEVIKQIDFRGTQVTQQQLQDYKEQCKRRKAEIQRVIDNSSFLHKLDTLIKS